MSRRLLSSIRVQPFLLSISPSSQLSKMSFVSYSCHPPTEEEVGILCFRNPNLKSIPSVFKHRFQDFHVHEVTPSGDVCGLSELVTKGVVAKEMAEIRSQKNQWLDSLGPTFEFSSEQKVELGGALQEEDIEALVAFLRSCGPGKSPEEGRYCLLSKTDVSVKEKRKAIHLTLKAVLGENVTSDTGEGGIRVFLKKDADASRKRAREEARDQVEEQGKRQRGGKNKKQKPKPRNAGEGAYSGPQMRFWEPWPADRPDWTEFILFKENRDTAQALDGLGKCLGNSPKKFYFAGSKDRRGVTYQRVQCYRTHIEQLKRALLNPQWDNMVRLGHFRYVKDKIDLGDLKGNLFKVALRGIPEDISSDDLASNLRSLQEQGFLNYFGLQRFGTQAIRTHAVGARIIREDWRGAVRMILGSKDGEEVPRDASEIRGGEGPRDMRAQARQRQIKEARHAYFVKDDPVAAVDILPSSCYVEKIVLKKLIHDPSNFLGALQALPKGSISLYSHAVQSYVWNFALSERVSKFGYEPVVGDLILKEAGDLFENAIEVDEEDESLKKRGLPEVEEVTESNISSVRFDQLVLPLPGSEVQYPPNMKGWYESFCVGRLGIHPSQFGMSTSGSVMKVAMMSLKGTYRRLVATPLPESVGSEFFPKEVDTKDKVIIRSDVDKLLRPDETELRSAKSLQQDASVAGLAAAVVKCSLPPSCYMTMALREATRESTERRDVDYL